MPPHYMSSRRSKFPWMLSAVITWTTILHYYISFNSNRITLQSEDGQISFDKVTSENTLPEETTNSTALKNGQLNIPLRYKPPPSAEINGTGRKMIVSPDLMKSLGIPFTEFSQLTIKTVSQFVFVTAISSNHYKESLDAVASVQTYMPGYKIVYYDIGLREDQVEKVKALCDVVYKKFNFSMYPAHVSNLLNYAFKPLIVQEVLLTHSGVQWMDASVRLLRNMTSVYTQIIETEGFLQFWLSPHTNYPVTHPGLYNYIPTNQQLQKTVRSKGAAAIFWYKTKNVSRWLFYWWVICALDPLCISPIGARLNCNFTVDSEYAGCHRYDMAVLNLLSSNRFGYDVTVYTARDQGVLKLMKHVTALFTVKKCS